MAAAGYEVVKDQRFFVRPRYSGLAYIGEGAYGIVWFVSLLAYGVNI